MKIKITGSIKRLSNGEFKVNLQAENSDDIVDEIFVINHKVVDKGERVATSFDGIATLKQLKNLDRTGRVSIQEFQYSGVLGRESLARLNEFGEIFKNLENARHFVDDIEEQVEELAEKWKAEDFAKEDIRIVVS